MDQSLKYRVQQMDHPLISRFNCWVNLLSFKWRLNSEQSIRLCLRVKQLKIDIFNYKSVGSYLRNCFDFLVDVHRF